MKRLRGKVLVVDDEPALLEIISTRLAFLAERVEVAKDGADAWRKIEADPPDVLVTDLMMPEVDGEELCKRVRASSHAKSIHILVLTARRGVDRRVAGFEFGADDYLEKPFDLEELAARVRTGLRTRALLREVEEVARHNTIGWVAYAFGHEIRNPLAAIMANASLQQDHVDFVQGLGDAAREAALALDAAGLSGDAAALRAAVDAQGGASFIASDIREMAEVNLRLARRAAAAVSALQRFAEGASGAPRAADAADLLDDAIGLAFCGSDLVPTVQMPSNLPAVWCVPRDVVLALATALARAASPSRKGPTPTVEAGVMQDWVMIRIDGPGDGTAPNELITPRIADKIPGESRSGLDLGLVHALVALRASGAGLSVGPRGDGGVVVEILLPRAPVQEQPGPQPAQGD